MFNSRFILLIIIVHFSWQAKSQTLKLSLPTAIDLAQRNSYEGKLSNHTYWSASQDLVNYKMTHRPRLSLYAKPFTYNQSFSKQFSPSDSSYKYFQEQNLNSYVSLEANQILPFSGGTVYIDSDLGRLANYGRGENAQFSATTLRVGILQPIFGYNPYKWDKQLQPLQYEKSKREYIESKEEIALKTINYFFDLVQARLNHEMALTSKANADSLYKTGLKRYDIAAINKEDLLALKLEVINSQSRLKQTGSSYTKVKNQLYTFLNLEQEMELIIPDSILNFTLDPNTVIAITKKNNPAYLSFQQQILQHERNVERARIESRPNINLNASYGFNQRSESFAGVYNDPTNQTRVDLTLRIPIIDWGVNRSKYKLAQKEEDLSAINIRQQESALIQEILLTIDYFNNQNEIVQQAREAAAISSEVFNIKMQRFLIGGNTNISDLLTQASKKESAVQAYYAEIKEYWKLYYTIRKISLHDFISDESLLKDSSPLTKD